MPDHKQIPLMMTASLGRTTLQSRDAMNVWVQMLRTYTKAQHRMAQVFRQHQLTSPQFDVLATLHRGEGLMQQELAARLLVTKGNICGVLDRMEAAGWIERHPDPGDRRANGIYLTEAGRSVFAEVIPVHHAVIQEVLGAFPREELQTLQNLLKKLEDAIEK